jgi:hypothetical protein
MSSNELHIRVLRTTKLVNSPIPYFLTKKKILQVFDKLFKNV